MHYFEYSLVAECIGHGSVSQVYNVALFCSTHPNYLLGSDCGDCHSFFTTMAIAFQSFRFDEWKLLKRLRFSC